MRRCLSAAGCIFIQMEKNPGLSENGAGRTQGSSPVRVLVVDDEVRVADSLSEILIRNGYEAVAAYSAEAAMKLAERVKPDALVSDIVMGPVSGIELANHVLEHFPKCRVLLISGHASKRNAVDGASPVQFLPKPVSPDRVLEFVGACANHNSAGAPPPSN